MTSRLRKNAPCIPDANVTADHLIEGDTLGGGSLVSSNGAIELWAGMPGPVVFAK